MKNGGSIKVGVNILGYGTIQNDVKYEQKIEIDGRIFIIIILMWI